MWCSFDVTNLFTNIPLQETIDIILSYLFVGTNNVVLGLSRKLFSDLLQLAVLNSFFVFNQKLYRQIEGLGMGLPLAPTLANIFMSHHEQEVHGCSNAMNILNPYFTVDTLTIPLFYFLTNLMLPNFYNI